MVSGRIFTGFLKKKGFHSLQRWQATPSLFTSIFEGQIKPVFERESFVAKQVPSSVFDLKQPPGLAFARVLGWPSIIPAHVLGADPCKHVMHSPTHAFFVKLSHVKVSPSGFALKQHGAPHRRMFARVPRCPSIKSAHVLDADCDAGPCKHVMHSLTHASFVNPHHVVRTECPHNGILDRQHCHWPFTDKCSMQSLAVGLHKSKLGKRRNLSTLALHDLENQLEGTSCTVQTLDAQTGGSQEAQIITEKALVVGHGIGFRQGGPISKVDDADRNKAEMVVTEGEDESMEMEESTDSEEEFYDYIEAEDSTDELLSALVNLEENLPAEDRRICCTLLRLAELCNDTGGNPEKILDYARKAFHNFDASKVPMKSAKSLLMIGIAHYKMGEFKEAVAPLERSAMMMEKLEVPVDKQQELVALQYNVQAVLGQAKMSLGWYHEGLLDFQKGLTAMERTLPPGNPHLGACYQQAAEAYMQAKNPEKALSLCLKALPIYTNHYGPTSSAVADLRSLMLLFYSELDDYEKVLSECQLAGPILENLGKSEEAMSLNLESMQAFFHLGKFNEAVTKLNEIIKKTEEENPVHVEALILLVRAYAGLKEDTTAAEYCKKALNVLERNKLSFESTKSLVRLSMAYERLQNYEQAMAIIQRALKFFEHCPEKEAAAVAADVEGHTGFLYLYMGKPNEALPYLERSVARKKSIYGPESVEVLDVCNHLGVAYAHVEKLDEALAVFEAAKMIVTKNSASADSMAIYIYNNLSLTCSIVGRIAEAIDCKKLAIDSMKKKGKTISFHLDEAEEELEALVQAAKRGGAVNENNEQALGKMLRACTQSHAMK